MHSKFLGVWFYAVYSVRAVHAHVYVFPLPFWTRRLELLPDYRLANKVCMQRVHTHTGTGAVVFPRR